MEYSAIKGKIAKLIIKRDHKLQLTADCTDIDKLKSLYKDIEDIREQLKVLKAEVLKDFLLDGI